MKIESQFLKSELNEYELKYLMTKKEKDKYSLIIENITELLNSDKNLLDLKEEIKKCIENNDSPLILDEYFDLIENQKKRIKEDEARFNKIHIDYENLLVSTKNDHKLLIEKTKLNLELSKTIKFLEKEIEKLEKQMLEFAKTGKIIKKEDIKIENEDNSDDELNIEEIDAYENNFKMKNKLKEKELLMMTGNLQAKEQLLKQMSKGHIIMQNVIINF